MTAPLAPTPHHHIIELQSIRGLAALIVLLHHCTFTFIGPGRFNLVAQALLNAHAAVVVFFVLSGYVLTRQLIGRAVTPAGVGQFFTSRVFRIFPALWVSLFFVALYYFAHGNEVRPIGTSTWFSIMSDAPPWKRYFARGALGVDSTLLHTLWSITVELEGSLILPLVALSVRRGRGAWALCQILLMVACWTDWPNEYTRYLQAFGFGASICLFAPYASRWELPFARVVAVLAAVVMLFFRLLSPSWRFLVDYAAITPCLVETLCATVLIVT